MHILERAIECTGLTQAAFAKALGKTDELGNGRQSYVSMLLRRVVKLGRPIPTDICPAIESATEGQVTRYDLRPDVFGHAPKPKRRAA